MFKISNKLGILGEEIAAKYLISKGFKILATNYTNPSGKRLGEIDIIAEINKEIVFVEVKMRKGNSDSIVPEENINSKKLLRLRKIANHYIKTNDFWEKIYRFDAISIIYNQKENKARVKHLETFLYRLFIF